MKVCAIRTQSSRHRYCEGHHGVVHELSLCQAIAAVVKPHAAGRHVELVRVRIGALRQVVPESLEYCWSLVREHFDANLVDAALELELVATEVACRACGECSPVESRWSVSCPRCGNADVEVVCGNEFLVTSVQVS